MTTAAGFAGAALANLRSRNGLAGHLERVVIGDPRDSAGLAENSVRRLHHAFRAAVGG